MQFPHGIIYIAWLRKQKLGPIRAKGVFSSRPRSEGPAIPIDFVASTIVGLLESYSCCSSRQDTRRCRRLAPLLFLFMLPGRVTRYRWLPAHTTAPCMLPGLRRVAILGNADSPKNMMKRSEIQQARDRSILRLSFRTSRLLKRLHPLFEHCQADSHYTRCNVY